ncbi:MAG: hypothetical protein ABIH19_04035 [Candidatus Omnitrophota bacterium]
MRRVIKLLNCFIFIFIMVSSLYAEDDSRIIKLDQQKDKYFQVKK